MNSTLKHPLNYLLICCCLVLCACGAPSNDMGGIDASGGRIAGTVSTGAINGFGSVIVNGVRYNSDKAKILINNQVATEDNLRTGYQVKITGSIESNGSALADTIEFSPNLVGAITNINLTAQQLTVLGHLVQVNSATLFDAAIKPNYLAGLKLGDAILVSGFYDDQGVITATRIELNSNANRQAMGYISYLNDANFTFNIKTLSVNYSAAALSNFNNTALAANTLVVVTGSLDAKGVLQAKTLVRINNSFDKDIKSAETEGFVTRFLSTTDFDVAGTRWAAGTQTIFENGSSANLALGIALSIKGEINSTGILTAQKVEFKSAPKNEIAGEVTSITPLASGNIAAGSLQISGTTIQTNSKTAFEDKGIANLKRFNFNSINTGDFLKISGYSNQGIFIATKIERQDVKAENNTEIKFNGIITTIGTHSFTLYGRIVLTNSETIIIDNNRKEIAEAQFYLQAIGKRVRVEGILKNGIFTASNIEIAEEN